MLRPTYELKHEARMSVRLAKELAKDIGEICRYCCGICYMVNTAGMVWRCPHYDVTTIWGPV